MHYFVTNYGTCMNLNKTYRQWIKGRTDNNAHKEKYRQIKIYYFTYINKQTNKQAYSHILPGWPPYARSEHSDIGPVVGSSALTPQASASPGQVRLWTAPPWSTSRCGVQPCAEVWFSGNRETSKGSGKRHTCTVEPRLAVTSVIRSPH